jgi:class 3 adenylate cyclase
MPTCHVCRQDNPVGARFCNACGAPLDGEARPLREERKVVTVLFADLVGSTARSERMDPEDVQRLLQPYHARLRSVLERHGGTVAKFVGDAVMAIFGAPVAHEDDPERAVRAALAIREELAASGELQVHIGITTGEALITLDAKVEKGEHTASGDSVNTAVRLESAAPAGSIFVDEATRRATERSIEFGNAPPVVAKGKSDPIRVWDAGRGLRRLAAAPGGAGGGTTARPRLRRPALGGRCIARLRGSPRRLGQRRSDPGARHGPSRSP